NHNPRRLGAKIPIRGPRRPRDRTRLGAGARGLGRSRPMRHHGRFHAAVLALALSMLSLTPRPAPAPVPLPARPADSWIVDTAGLLSAEEVEDLRAVSERIARERGIRLVLLAIPSLGGEEPKPIAVRALNDWRAGRRSVLLLVSREPRKLYLQPGI